MSEILRAVVTGTAIGAVGALFVLAFGLPFPLGLGGVLLVACIAVDMDW